VTIQHIRHRYGAMTSERSTENEGSTGVSSEETLVGTQGSSQGDKGKRSKCGPKKINVVIAKEAKGKVQYNVVVVGCEDGFLGKAEELPG